MGETCRRTLNTRCLSDFTTAGFRTPYGSGSSHVAGRDLSHGPFRVSRQPPSRHSCHLHRLQIESCVLGYLNVLLGETCYSAPEYGQPSIQLLRQMLRTTPLQTIRPKELPHKVNIIKTAYAVESSGSVVAGGASFFSRAITYV
jgi:hypothetical protein